MATRPADLIMASEALRACRLFASLDEPTFAMLAEALRVRRFRRGEVVFHAGDPGEALFVVATGSVKILLPADDGTESAILTTIGPGGFFGELALLDGAPRSASAIALGPVESFVLHRDSFDRLVDEQPTLRRALLAALAGEIRRLTSQVEDLHFLDLPGRLARHLLRRVTEAAGDAPPGPVRLAWPFTQAELAGMIGGSRQSVNRLLADFVDRGLLLFDGDTLVVPDPAALAEATRR